MMQSKLSKFCICAFILLANAFVAPVTGQTESVEDRALLYSQAIYGNGFLDSDQVVELLAGRPSEILGLLSIELYEQENSIAHLIAKRGHISSLFHLLERLTPGDRAQMAKRLNNSYKDGLLVQHRIVMGSSSLYWIRQFQNLGLDFSIPPKSDQAVDALKHAVINRWGEETDAYSKYLALTNGAKSLNEDSFEYSDTKQRIKKITYLYRSKPRPIAPAQNDALLEHLPKLKPTRPFPTSPKSTPHPPR